MGDTVFIASICGVATLGVMSVNHPKPPALPYPPGQTAFGSKVEKAPGPPTAQEIAATNSVLTAFRVHKAAVVMVPPNVTFTCDIGAGGFDGVNLYEARDPADLGLLMSFVPTNVFAVTLDTNWPHFLEVRTMIKWPAPGVVETFTNDDGSTTDVTHTYYESPVVSDFLWVPTGMTNQWLARMQDGTLELIGYGAAGATYTVKRGALNGVWETLGTIPGTNGPWTIPDDGQAGPAPNGGRFFWTTVSNF